MDIWQEIVNISEKKENDAFAVEDGTLLLFVGNKKAGKTTLIYRFLNRDEEPKPTLALEYTFGRQNRANLLSKDVCHIWELGNGTLFTNLLQFPLNSNICLQNLSVVVVLDLSVPNELILTLNSTLDSVRSLIDRVLSTETAKKSNLRQILTDLAWKRIGTDHPDRDVVRPFLVPLIVIGGKYDIFQNLEPEQRKIVCRTLRYFAHMNGATLQFLSSKMENLVNRARVLLSVVAFGTAMTPHVSQDYTKPLFIPVGVDTLKQIGFIRDGEVDNSKESLWKTAFESYFPQSLKKSDLLPDDPAKDPNFKEPLIDNLRLQRDTELDRMMKEIDKKI